MAPTSARTTRPRRCTASARTPRRRIAQQQYQQPLAATDAVRSSAAVRAEAAVELKTNRYDAASDTLHLTAPEAAAYRQQIGYWTRLLPRPRAQRRAEAGPDHRSGRAAPVHRVRHLGRVGVGGQSPGRGLLLYQQLSLRSRASAIVPTPGALLWSALSLMVLLAGIAAVLLAFGKFDYLGWISARPSRPPARAAGRASAGPARAGQVLRRRRAAVSGADAGRRRRRALPRRSRQLLRLRAGDDLSRATCCAPGICRLAIFWIATAYVAAALFLGRSLRARRAALASAAAIAPAVRRVRRRHRRQPARRMGSASRSCSAHWWFWLGNQGWEYLELGRVWQYLLVGRPAGLVRAAVVAGAAARRWRTPSARPLVTDVPDRGAGDPGVLPAGAVLRRQDQLHDRRHLALLDHPSVGRRLLRVLRHHGRRADVLPARPDAGATRRCA